MKAGSRDPRRGTEEEKTVEGSEAEDESSRWSQSHDSGEPTTTTTSSSSFHPSYYDHASLTPAELRVRQQAVSNLLGNQRRSHARQPKPMGHDDTPSQVRQHAADLVEITTAIHRPDQGQVVAMEPPTELGDFKQGGILTIPELRRRQRQSRDNQDYQALATALHKVQSSSHDELPFAQENAPLYQTLDALPASEVPSDISYKELYDTLSQIRQRRQDGRRVPSDLEYKELWQTLEQIHARRQEQSAFDDRARSLSQVPSNPALVNTYVPFVYGHPVATNTETDRNDPDGARRRLVPCSRRTMAVMMLVLIAVVIALVVIVVRRTSPREANVAPPPTPEPTVTPTSPAPTTTTPTLVPSPLPSTEQPTTALPTLVPTHEPSSSNATSGCAEDNIFCPPSPTSSPQGNNTLTSAPTGELQNRPTLRPANFSNASSLLPTIAPTPSFGDEVSFLPTEKPSTTAPSFTPSDQPTPLATARPSRFPVRTTNLPTLQPTLLPTSLPPSTVPTTPVPTSSQTIAPTGTPTLRPTIAPTRTPSVSPTNLPTIFPTTLEPTLMPTMQPTKEPTSFPTREPSPFPTRRPTRDPTRQPTDSPTRRPTRPPTRNPTNPPTGSPTPRPTPRPTRNPTPRPTPRPTPFPTEPPVLAPGQCDICASERNCGTSGPVGTTFTVQATGMFDSIWFVTCRATRLDVADCFYSPNNDPDLRRVPDSQSLDDANASCGSGKVLQLHLPALSRA